jgi:hypothetical protein
MILENEGRRLRLTFFVCLPQSSFLEETMIVVDLLINYDSITTTTTTATSAL